MRDPNRIFYILDMLRLAWEKDPDLRFGQLITNAFALYHEQGMSDAEFWSRFRLAEDDVWYRLLEKYSD